MTTQKHEAADYLRKKIIRSLSNVNMQDAGSEVSEILIEGEADKILELMKAWHTAELRKLLEAWPEHRLNNQPDYLEFPEQYSQGYNAAINDTKAILLAAIERHEAS